MKFGAELAIVGALAGAAVGVGSGVASADPAVPDSPGVAWKLDKHDHDWEDWNNDWHRGRWDGPRYGSHCAWVPPAVSMWVPPAAC